MTQAQIEALITLITDAANELAERRTSAGRVWKALLLSGQLPARPAIYTALEDAALYNALYALTGCDELYAMAADFEPEPDSQDGPTDADFDYVTAQAGASFYR